jgi:hypothetical protein
MQVLYVGAKLPYPTEKSKEMRWGGTFVVAHAEAQTYPIKWDLHPY